MDNFFSKLINLIASVCLSGGILTGCDSRDQNVQDHAFSCGMMESQKIKVPSAYLFFPPKYEGIDQWINQRDKNPDLSGCTTKIDSITLNVNLENFGPFFERKPDATDEREISVTYLSLRNQFPLHDLLRIKKSSKKSIHEISGFSGYEVYIAENIGVVGRDTYSYYLIKRESGQVVEFIDCFSKHLGRLDMCSYKFKGAGDYYLDIRAGSIFVSDTAVLKNHAKTILKKVSI